MELSATWLQSLEIEKWNGCESGVQFFVLCLWRGRGKRITAEEIKANGIVGIDNILKNSVLEVRRNSSEYVR